MKRFLVLTLALILTVTPALMAQSNPGQNGQNGQQGQNGEEGEKNQNGQQGQNGEEGEKNQNGQQGQNGEEGEKNQNGLQGQNGEEGEKGQGGEQGLISKDTAIKAALHEIKGEVVSVKRGERDDVDVYVVRLKTTDGRVDVSVDAHKGIVLHIDAV